MSFGLKHSVKVRGVTPELLIGIMAVWSVYEEYEFPCLITSLNDSEHGHGSLHFSGNGVDFRVRDPSGDWNIPDRTRVEMAQDIKILLTDDYDFVIELDHFHLEYQPKDAG